MFRLQAVLQSLQLQLYTSPVINLGTIGALQPKCSKFVAAMPILRGLATGVRSAHCVGLVCGVPCVVLMSRVCGPLLVLCRVRVYIVLA